MGILKHAVLPILAVGHAFQAYKIMADGKEALPKFYGWPGAESPMSPRELHMMGVILSISVTLLVNCVAGIFLENAHYRGMATLLELVFFSCELYDAQVTGFPTMVKAVFAAVALVGLVVHSMEPGVFTKDKSKNKSS
jgi:hypothetical protein